MNLNCFKSNNLISILRKVGYHDKESVLAGILSSTREKTLEVSKEEIVVYFVEYCGLNSIGSYDESLLKKKTYRCF